ncbi:hairy-related 5 [Melanotaenia boesemani]|uniref:hairy-related 5 n=1 Tax=Melanotaenia boesemani TaxID=1250792 RepID=UPI001C04131A|nr:hairy-related 5 [Melanotaenia boesemani]
MHHSFSLDPKYQQSQAIADAMKALSSPESTRKKSARRVSKPLMEKRRRERINHSLETLRLLMLENTRNEKLKNPKVEKAEILESVVEFLKAEKEMEKGPQATGRVLSKEPRQTCPRQHSYRDGMRSCLLRVSQFIATKSQELEESGNNIVQASFALAEPKELPTSPGHVHRSSMAALAGDSTALSPQHHLTQPPGLHGDTNKFFSTSAGSTHITDPVWRPWPQ